MTASADARPFFLLFLSWFCNLERQLMARMEDMKRKRKKTGQNRNPKKKGAGKGRKYWDDLLVVWYLGLVFLVISGVLGVGGCGVWFGLAWERQGTGVFGS